MKILFLNAEAKGYVAIKEILLTIQNSIPNNHPTDIICLGNKNIEFYM